MKLGNIGGFAAQEGIYRKFEESLRVGSNALGKGTEVERGKRVVEEFASLLIFEVIKAMRATIPRGGLSEEDSLQRDIYTSLADMEVARALASRNGLGLGKFVEEALGEIGKSNKQQAVSSEQQAVSRKQRTKIS